MRLVLASLFLTNPSPVDVVSPPNLQPAGHRGRQRVRGRHPHRQLRVAQRFGHPRHRRRFAAEGGGAVIPGARGGLQGGTWGSPQR